MEVVRTIAEARRAVAAARQTGRRIGFVPTMGALHAGHVALIDAARRADTWPVVSIFVNPTQFAPHEDFDRYPRDEAGDFAICRTAGTGLVFAPAPAEIYPPPAHTQIHIAELTRGLCGPHRPGHFDGVALVVTKLLNIIQPDEAYFGEKDYQQLAIVRQLVRDLNLPVNIVGCPTVREPDGLALSSRNRYLSPEERRRAAGLPRALLAARAAALAGENDARLLEQQTRAQIERDARPDRIDYVSIVDGETLAAIERVNIQAVLAAAIWMGRTRLIDEIKLMKDGD